MPMRFHGYSSVQEWIRVCENDRSTHWRITTYAYRRGEDAPDKSSDERVLSYMDQIPCGDKKSNVFDERPEILTLLILELPDSQTAVPSWHLFDERLESYYADGCRDTFEWFLNEIGYELAGVCQQRI